MNGIALKNGLLMLKRLVDTCGEGMDLDIDEFSSVMEKCDEAMSEHPRNCEVGTPKERLERFREFCQDKEACTKCFGNKTLGLEVECFATWEDMPYDEKKKGEDNKYAHVGAVCRDCARKAGFTPKDKVVGAWVGECGIMCEIARQEGESK